MSLMLISNLRTWLENTYPGCACDACSRKGRLVTHVADLIYIPSHAYTYNFALNVSS